MKEFKSVFERLVTKYAEYVEAKIVLAGETQTQPAERTPELSRELQDEVRTVNVLAVTLARMEAQETGVPFGMSAEIQPFSHS